MQEDDEVSMVYNSSGNHRGTGAYRENPSSESENSLDQRSRCRGDSRFRKDESSFDSDESLRNIRGYKTSFLPSTSACERLKKGIGLSPETPSSESSSSLDQRSRHPRQSGLEKYISAYEIGELLSSRKKKRALKLHDSSIAFLPSTSGYKGKHKKGAENFYRKFAEATSSESQGSDMERRFGGRSQSKWRKIVSSIETVDSCQTLRGLMPPFLRSTSGYKSHRKKGTGTFYKKTEEVTSSESDSSDTGRRSGYHFQGISNRPETTSSESEDSHTGRRSGCRSLRRSRKYASSLESDDSQIPKKRTKRLYDYDSIFPPSITTYKSTEIKVTVEETRFHFMRKRPDESNRRSALMFERLRESPESSWHPTKKRYDYDSSSMASTSTYKDNRKRQKVSPEDIGLKFREISSEALFSKRPGFGEQGRQIKIVSNCYPIKFPTGYVYHYDIEIIENNQQKAPYSGFKKYCCLNTKRSREVLAFILENNPEFKGAYGAFDGRKNLLTNKELEINLPFRCAVMLPNRKSRGGPPDLKYDNFRVEIKSLVSKINLDTIQDFYQSKCNVLPQEAMMALEIILRNDPCLKLTPIGRSFFYPPHFRNLTPFGGGLEIWFGYHQSIRLGQWKPTVNLDVSATIFWEAGPVLNYIADYMNMPVRNLRNLRFLHRNDIRRINRRLKQRRVKVTHLSYGRRYRVIRLRDISANQECIEFTHDGNKTRMSVAQYFKDTYGIHLEYGNLPCLQVQPEKRNIFMPLEVCEFLGGQHYKGELTPGQKSRMIGFTSSAPIERFRKIQDIVNESDFNSDKIVKGFKLEISDRPLIADARVLDSPNLVYKDKYNSEITVLPHDGLWDIRNTQFFRGAVISRWVLLSFYSDPNLGIFADLLGETGRNLGLQLGELSDIMVLRDSNCDKKELFSDLKEKKNEFAVIIIPKVGEVEEKRIYAEIKKVAETEVGLPTQCIKEDTLRVLSENRGLQIVSNLCLKINAKLGGENHTLYERDMPSILCKPVIIIGADVNHPAVTQRNQPSIAACVGSLDCIGKRFGVSIRAQVHSKNQKKVEEIITLEDMIYDLLLTFYKHTKRQRPEKIIFYRDGVSEGELINVKNREILSIRKACRRLDEDYQPGITVIVVQKRHHIRFKPMDRRDGVGRKGNIPPGTVIDTDVTHPVNFDFFLCSQFVPQGTSRPSHYLVLEDDNDFSADELQKLTFHMCHMYARCTKSISIPAPVAYADLVAYRARRHLDSRKEEDPRPSKDYARSYRLTQDDMDAIEVVGELKDSMYFV